jgi:hypothetical protein
VGENINTEWEIRVMAFFEQGRYKAEIILAQQTKSKGKGTPQVELHLQLLAAMGDGADKDVEYDPPRTKFPPVIYLALTEGTLGTPGNPGWVTEVLQYIGFDGDFEHLPQVEGWKGFVYCGEEKDLQGIMRDKWSIEMSRGPKVIPQDKNEAKKLTRQFGGLFKKAQPASTAPPAAPEQQENPAEQQEPSPTPPARTAGRKPQHQPASVGNNGSRADEDIPF